MSDSISPKFFNFVAQVAHTATTYALSYTVLVKFGWRGYFVAASLILAYAAIHEFWYDAKFENPATRGSDLEDFCFLCLGPALAALVNWL